MPVPLDLSKLSVRQFAERFRGEMIPLSSTFSYFCANGPMSEEDLKEYLEEPVAALPPSVIAVLPKISILLVPYLERVNGRSEGKPESRRAESARNRAGAAQTGKLQSEKKPDAQDNSGKEEKPGTGGDFVSVEKPPQDRTSSYTQLKLGDETVLAFALKDQEVAEYHYRLYHLLAAVLGDHWSEEVENKYTRILREEMSADVHGEVDEASWRVKQGLRRGKTG